VSSEQVAEPVAVRYAWADNPEEANFYNIEGLPASPFRTDNWERTEYIEKIFFFSKIRVGFKFSPP
jgi:sialate O-acetylesterase